MPQKKRCLHLAKSAASSHQCICNRPLAGGGSPANSSWRILLPSRLSARTYPCGIQIEIVSASLFFCSDFSGDELKGGENQATCSSGRVKDYAAVSVPGIKSRLCSYPLP